MLNKAAPQVGVIEAGALESKLIVLGFFASSSSVSLDSTDWCDSNRALFAGCTFKQLAFGVGASLGGLDLIRQRADIGSGSI